MRGSTDPSNLDGDKDVWLKNRIVEIKEQLLDMSDTVNECASNARQLKLPTGVKDKLVMFCTHFALMMKQILVDDVYYRNHWSLAYAKQVYSTDKKVHEIPVIAEGDIYVDFVPVLGSWSKEQVSEQRYVMLMALYLYEKARESKEKNWGDVMAQIGTYPPKVEFPDWAKLSLQEQGIDGSEKVWRERYMAKGLVHKFYARSKKGEIKNAAGSDIVAQGSTGRWRSGNKVAQVINSGSKDQGSKNPSSSKVAIKRGAQV